MGHAQFPRRRRVPEAERLLADPRLHVSDRHRAFLRYIVDARFEGRSDTIKAYSIAIDVFNRPASFDPSSDPIVRIEATRLRESLQKYYAQITDEPGARLDIPRGRYVPVFVERDQPPCPDEDGELQDVGQPAEEPTQAASRPDGRKWRHAIVGGAALFAAALIGGLAYEAASPTLPDTQKPFVALSINASQNDKAAGEAVMEDLAVSLARFGTVRLKSGASGSRVPRDAMEQSLYEINMRYAENESLVSLWWQVSDAASGEAVWTDEERRTVAAGMREEAMRDLVFSVSRRLARPAGIINAIELRRNLPASTIGNVCVLRGEFAVEQRDAAGLKAARSCLAATIAADPTDADAMATLARVYVWIGRATGDDSYFGRGLELANRAATLSPSSPRAALAQLGVQYQLGQNEISIAAGRRGVALNPENADLLAKLSMVVFLTGHWDEGAACQTGCGDRRPAHTRCKLRPDPRRISPGTLRASRVPRTAGSGTGRADDGFEAGRDRSPRRPASDGAGDSRSPVAASRSRADGRCDVLRSALRQQSQKRVARRHSGSRPENAGTRQQRCDVTVTSLSERLRWHSFDRSADRGR
ncbi:tetratricopeptide repeat protein [Rhizobium beringeri]